MSHRALNLKQRLAGGETVIGAWLALGHPVVAEIMATTGFDFILIDGEHAAFSLETLQTVLIAFNGTATVPIVRVPWNDPVRIKQTLDVGAEGILSPMVNSVAEAQALVAACKYPPAGSRGFGPHRGSSYYRATAAYMEIANDSVIVIPQIEHIATLPLLDGILEVPGIDALCVGPNDLSASAGLLGQLDHPTVRAALERILATAKQRGVAVCPGVPLAVAEQSWWAQRGARLLLATWDIGLLAEGARAALAEHQRFRQA